MALRCWMLAGPLRMLDPDEAVTGLMAARIADGQQYAFFAGQRYMGALEQYLQAPFAALTPGNAFLLRLPQVALAAWAGWLVYLLGSRMFGEWRAVLAGWLFAAGPAFNLMYSGKSRGAYGAALVAGLLGLLLAVRHRAGRGEVRTAAAFGCCCGLAGWLSVLAAVLLLPALVWLAGSRWHRRRVAVGSAALGCLLGSLPLLLDWARAGVTTGLGTSPPSSPGERLRGLGNPVLPEFLGLAWRVGEPVLPSVVGIAAGFVLAAGWILAAARRRHGLRALITLRADERQPSDLLLLAVPVLVLVYVGSPYTWYTAEPRYLFAAYPLLALGLAAVLPSRGAGAAVVVAIAGVAAGTLAAKAGTDYRGDLARAAVFLERAGQRTVYTDYQLGYPLSYYQGSRVTAVPYGANADRFPNLYQAVDAAPRPAYAVLAVNARRISEALARQRVPHRAARFGEIWTFTDLRPTATPGQLGLTH